MNDRRRPPGDTGFDSGADQKPTRPGQPAVRPAAAPQTKPGAPAKAQTGPRPTLTTGPRATIPAQKAVRTQSSQGTPAQKAGRTQSSQGTPAQRTQSSLSNPRVAAMPDNALGANERPSEVRRALTQTAFKDDDDERTQLDSMLSGRGRQREDDADEDEATTIGEEYDGVRPAKEVVSRDLWKAINAPVQSRAGRRSAQLYKLVIDQFAVGHNPRYEPDAPDKPRAHIFVWDVTRAMNCEVPHFVGPRELTLAQTVDWIRHEGPMRGWRRVDFSEAAEATAEGQCVIAMPKDIKVKLLGVCRPKETTPDGKPKIAAAAKGRGNSLVSFLAFGTDQLEYFVHA